MACPHGGSHSGWHHMIISWWLVSYDQLDRAYCWGLRLVVSELFDGIMQLAVLWCLVLHDVVFQSVCRDRYADASVCLQLHAVLSICLLFTCLNHA
jgi:hypothetical protein